jgi:hypothetical protein
MSCPDRFIRKLEIRNDVNIGDVELAVQNQLIGMMLSNNMPVLMHLNDALDDIDLSLSHGDILQGSLQDWRNKFGRWRKAYCRNTSHWIISVEC